MYGLQVLDSWLYDDRLPFIHIEANDTFAELRKEVKSGYFEGLVQKYLLDNTHRSVVILQPKLGLLEEQEQKQREKMAQVKAAMSPEELEAVKEARAQGDLSENFEYKAAKQDKNRNESRIRYLERMLKNAKIVSDTSKADEVGINNTVEVYFEDDDETETYRLVTSIRGNSLQGLISIESPLGKAIQGHKVGDRVLVKTNGNDGYYIVIKNIDNTTDDSHDTLRKY